MENLIKEILAESRTLAKRLAMEAHPRSVLQTNSLYPDLVNAIQGVRRCGKSTLQSLLMSNKKINPSVCYFINFEDPRLAENLDHNLLTLILKIAEKEHPSKSCYFFFDEIQNVSLWEKWLHIEIAKKRHFFCITGSNSTLLEGELGTALTGRNKKLELFPFSYAEVLKADKKFNLEMYFETGGFPRILSMEQKEGQDLLRQYFSEIIERDVKRHVAARSGVLLTKIAKAVYESTGSETSLKKLAAQFQTTVETCKSYLDAYAKAYLILPCPYFTESERQRVVRPLKYYPIDLGIHNAITTRTKLDLGKKLECVVMQELRRRHKEVFYWRETGEVDFIIETQEGIQPIQVTWDKPQERHHNAFAEFKKHYPSALSGIVITKNNVEAFLKESP